MIRMLKYISVQSNYKVYQGSCLCLGKISEIIFRSLLTTFEASSIFWSSWDSSENWLKSKKAAWLDSLFCAFGVWLIKAACRTLMKLTPDTQGMKISSTLHIELTLVLSNNQLYWKKPFSFIESAPDDKKWKAAMAAYYPIFNCHKLHQNKWLRTLKLMCHESAENESAAFYV